MSETAQETAGGTGDAQNDHHQRADFGLYVRAVEQEWPITHEERKKIMVEMAKVAGAENTKPRTRAIATRVVAMLNAQNLSDRHHVERLEHDAGIFRLRAQRAEEGKPNDSLAIMSAPVRELPLPAALVQYRRKLLEPSES